MLKQTLIAAAALSIATAPMAHAGNSGSYTITLDGQQVAQGNTGGCTTDKWGAITFYLPNDMLKNRPPWDAYGQLNESGRVLTMTINKLNGTPQTGVLDVWQDDQGGGDSRRPPATKSGNNYKITGTVSNYTANKTHVPYEVDFTCT